ncbi:MAG: hypothetical protein LIO75_02830 [Lachnospiraceae bacterium]|nr:hypothetical protein [Lachnospiraceae bacterium]
MAVRDLLFEQDYDMGDQSVTFSLYREQDLAEVTVTLTYEFRQSGTEPVTCKRIFFPAKAEYKSPWLSWYNLICCSNNYGPIPVVSYMNAAVQNGKKLAATIYPDSADDYLRILAEVGDTYYCFPYHVQEYAFMLYISRKGTLGDYFDLDEILEIYESCDVHLARDKMLDYFGRELSWFGREEECPIELHNCLGDEELAVTGLLFGYPLESTVALIRKTIDLRE